MIFLGIGATPGLIKNTGLVTNIGPSPIWQSNDPNGYACSASGCRGQGLSDLLFHQLQTALNKTNAALSLYYRTTSTIAYPDPQITVNGVLDAATTASLDQIVMTNMVPGLSVHLDSAGIAANAGNLIASMNNWLTTQTTTTITNPPPCDPTVDRNCLMTNGGGGGDGNTVGPKPIDPNGGAPGRNNGGPQPTIYYCADGTKVTDPGMCQTAPQMYVCWDGSQVTDPSLCVPYPTPPQSGSNSVSPPAPSSTVVSVSTAPNGAVTVNTAPAIDPVAAADATPHLFGFPRNWVIGGFVAAGAALGIGVAIFSLRRRTAA